MTLSASPNKDVGQIRSYNVPVASKGSGTESALNIVDGIAIIITIIWLSRAWYYPSLSTADRPPGIEIINFANFAAGVYCFVRLLFAGRITSLLEEKILLLLLTIGSINILFSYSPMNTLGFVRTEFLMLATALYCRWKFGRKVLVQLIVEVLGVVILLSLLASFTSIGVMTGFDAGRWRGLFSHKNSLGEISAVLSVLLFGLYRIGYQLHLRHLIYAGAAALCLVFAGSATSLAASLLMLAILLIVEIVAKSRLSSNIKISLFLTGLVCSLTIAGIVIPIVTEALNRDLTFTGRTGIWDAFIFFGEQKPWTGWGWATIAQNEGMLGYIRQTLKLPTIQTPHNGYILLFVELGYPGLVVFCLWLLSNFLGSLRLAFLDIDMMHGLRVAILMGLIVHTFFEGTSGAAPSLWLLFLLASQTSASERTIDKDSLDDTAATDPLPVVLPRSSVHAEKSGFSGGVLRQ